MNLLPFDSEGFTRLFLTACLFLVFTNIGEAQDLYWVGGPGNWEDPAHWSKNSGGSPAGRIPDNRTHAIIDDNSGLKKLGDEIVLSPGTHPVRILEVTNQSPFTLAFTGVFGRAVTIFVAQDLLLSDNIEITYPVDEEFNNRWEFSGSGNHRLVTKGKDLNRVTFLEGSGTYNQEDDLLAGSRISFEAGTWNTNGFEVTTDYLLVQTPGGSNDQDTKILNADGSDIITDQFFARFSYGSLTMNGDYRVFARIFQGSPRQANGPVPYFSEIVLTEKSGREQGISVIEDNNFECSSCEIETIIIEDTEETRLAMPFTVTDELRMVNPDGTLLFGGGNGRAPEVTLNGTVSLPATTDCGGKTVIKSANTDFAEIYRDGGTLTISDAELIDLQAQPGASFRISNGILSGSSQGWDQINVPRPNTYVWVGQAGQFRNWNNPDYWRLSNGNRNGCIPTVIDDVEINADSKGSIIIDEDNDQRCRNLTWTNKNGLTMRFTDDIPALTNELEVAGDLTISASALVNDLGFSRIVLTGGAQQLVEVRNHQDLRIEFDNPKGTWDLNADLSVGSVAHTAGTIDTKGFDVDFDTWSGVGSENKHLKLRSSTLTGEEVLFGWQAVGWTTIDPGTSHLIVSDRMTTRVDSLHDVTFTNATTKAFENFEPISLATLRITNGGTIRPDNDLTVEELAFSDSGSTLSVDPQKSLTIIRSISSSTSTVDPAAIESQTATPFNINIEPGATCLDGIVAFNNVDATGGLKLHAPNGVDAGGNTGIDFTDAKSANVLYWIGGETAITSSSSWSTIPGGCRASIDPKFVDSLVVDDAGVQGDILLTVPGSTSLQTLLFTNANSPATLQMEGRLSLMGLVFENGRATLQGGQLDVNGETRVSGTSTVNFEEIEMQTDTFLGQGGQVFLKNTSQISVDN